MNLNFTEKIIKEVRKRPLIYLLNHPDYKNNTKKMQAWREIQRELNVEVKILKSKWKNLRDTYTKFKQSKRSNSSEGAKKLSNWAWAERMNFLDSSVSLNDTNESVSVDLSSANIESNDTSSTSKQIREVKHEIEFSAVDEPNDTSSIFEQIREVNREIEFSALDEPNDTSSTSEQIRELKHENEFSAVDETQNAQETYPMIQFLHNRRSSDEKVEVKCDGVDLLFLGYADTFKKLSRRKQVTVKFDIAKILMEAELSDLKETVAIASASETYSTTSSSHSTDRKSI